jgi:hypothetical protein
MPDPTPSTPALPEVGAQFRLSLPVLGKRGKTRSVLCTVTGSAERNGRTYVTVHSDWQGDGSIRLDEVHKVEWVDTDRSRVSGKDQTHE